jgi:hypothetical protein
MNCQGYIRGKHHMNPDVIEPLTFSIRKKSFFLTKLGMLFISESCKQKYTKEKLGNN